MNSEDDVAKTPVQDRIRFLSIFVQGNVPDAEVTQHAQGIYDLLGDKRRGRETVRQMKAR